MDWTEALEMMVARTHHERYRMLCADSHPDHEAYRVLMIRLATGEGILTSPIEDDFLRDYVAEHGCSGC
jgi:hypothetical protein